MKIIEDKDFRGVLIIYLIAVLLIVTGTVWVNHEINKEVHYYKEAR